MERLCGELSKLSWPGTGAASVSESMPHCPAKAAGSGTALARVPGLRVISGFLRKPTTEEEREPNLCTLKIIVEWVFSRTDVH